MFENDPADGWCGVSGGVSTDSREAVDEAQGGASRRHCGTRVQLGLLPFLGKPVVILSWKFRNFEIKEIREHKAMVSLDGLKGVGLGGLLKQANPKPLKMLCCHGGVSRDFFERESYGSASKKGLFACVRVGFRVLGLEANPKPQNDNQGPFGEPL